eukprot:RCo027603
MIAELGQLLVNLVNVVPDGLVLFFPSYAYEEAVFQKLKADGMIKKIEEKKQFFREPRSSDEAADVLRKYSEKILGDLARAKSEQPAADTLPKASRRGAVLSCVMGGKLSEGINFSDHLGRCVVAVGLPYPPPQDPLLREKMAHLSTKYGTKAAGEEFYESSCMKLVNQSIGRAVRHSGDYAAILLVDLRYGRPKTLARLPEWIRGSTVHHPSFGPAFQALRAFFVARLAQAT